MNEKKKKIKKCFKEECNKPASFKAPKSRNDLKSYIWFCEEHIREYNKSWNYCKNMTMNDIENHIRQDTVGWRPTWDFSSSDRGFKNIEKIFLNYFNFFNKRKRKLKQKKIEKEIKNALEVLNIKEKNFSLKEIESKYKKLVKKYHPDLNKGNKKHEETLKKINHSFTVIKNFFSKKIKLNNANG